MSISKPQATAFELSTVLESADRGLGVSEAEELDVAVHGLASGALHCDMDRATQVRSDDFGVSAKERKDLLLGDRVRNLLQVSKGGI